LFLVLIEGLKLIAKHSKGFRGLSVEGQDHTKTKALIGTNLKPLDEQL
jgi:hypothetical protein